jgi:MoaA/NifB/PqqE/SkfB family radical SAM enzyme
VPAARARLRRRGLRGRAFVGQGSRTIAGDGSAPWPALSVRLAPGVAVRAEPFGAVAYVCERDDFFALDPAYAAVALRAAGVGPDRRSERSPARQPSAVEGGGAYVVTGPDSHRARALAALGICATSPPTLERPHHGRSLVGDLAGLPVFDRPLVVNCFSTAHCPLLCAYCHADDLMTPFRESEGWSGVEAVAATAALVPAMVGVVTGGDPIVRPGRAAWLVARLATGKRVVLDTSGVGDIGPLLPVLRRHRVHVRVSLDSADREVNDRARPVSRAYLPHGASAYASAHRTLRDLREAGVACSVQTVVGSHNDTIGHLLALRDHLVDIGVRHWVLHVAVPAGKAARHRRVLPGDGAVDRLRDLVTECVSAGAPLDIRVTGTHRTPSAVLLVDPRGQLCVERSDGPGKRVIWRPVDGGGGPAVLAAYRDSVDLAGHASRYLNGTLESRPQPVPVPVA